MSYIYLKLFIITILPSTLTILIYYLKKNNYIDQNSKFESEVMIGIVFGIISIIANEFGVNFNDKSIISVRDAAPMIAGFIFSGTSGIVAGIIGGVERYMSVYWGGGAYTQVACSISTILSGFYAAFLRKYIFKNKLPLPFFGLISGAIMETIHLTIVLFTHINDSDIAFSILHVATAPMIITNSVAIFIALYLIKRFFKNNIKTFQTLDNISTKVQMYILTIIIIGFIITSYLTYLLQVNKGYSNADKLLKSNINKTFIDLRTALYNEELESFTNTINVSGKKDNIEGYVYLLDSEQKILSGPIEKYKRNLDEIGLNIDLNNEKKYTLLKKNIHKKLHFLMFEKYDNYYILCFIENSYIFQDINNMFLNNFYMQILVYATIFYLAFLSLQNAVVSKIENINEKLNKITKGNLDVIVDEVSTYEFANLSNNVNATVSSLKKHIEEEKHRIEKDMIFAKKIQQASLPSYFPAFKNNKEFDIYATMDTAKEVGGDFYDFYFCEPTKLTFLIADVSGKGIPAAMFMMKAKTTIKNLSQGSLPIEEIINKVNNELCDGNDAEMFVTAFIGILDITNGHIDFVNCGHNPPIIIKNEKAEYLISDKDFVLAGFEDYQYKKQSLDLQKGDKIYLYTDGVTEAMNDKKELYGEPKLLDLFNKKLYNSNIYDTLNEIKVDMDIFVNGAEQADDITMLEIIYNG